MATRTYGTISPEQRTAMSGLEFVEGLASGVLPLNTIAQTLGYDVVEAESGRVAITLETGLIRAEGKVLNCGRRVGTAEGRVTDAKGQLLAHGTTTCLIFPS
jgi:acyl-coenzyme A thioesterase PaaI-like protein